MVSSGNVVLCILGSCPCMRSKSLFWISFLGINLLGFGYVVFISLSMALPRMFCSQNSIVLNVAILCLVLYSSTLPSYGNFGDLSVCFLIYVFFSNLFML